MRDDPEFRLTCTTSASTGVHSKTIFDLPWNTATVSWLFRKRLRKDITKRKSSFYCAGVHRSKAFFQIVFIQEKEWDGLANPIRQTIDELLGILVRS